MEQIRPEVRLLYYLTLSKPDLALDNMVQDGEAFTLYIKFCNEREGNAETSQMVKRILKRLRFQGKPAA